MPEWSDLPRRPREYPPEQARPRADGAPEAVPGYRPEDMMAPGPEDIAEEPSGATELHQPELPETAAVQEIREARRDLKDAQHEVTDILRRIDGLEEFQRIKIADFRSQVDAINRVLQRMDELLEHGSAVSGNMIVSATVQTQIANEVGTSDLSSADADGPLKQILEKCLGRLKFVGPRLLSMNLHLFPLKEWTLSGEFNVAILKGTISLTFRDD
jgi:hypothetical protein